MAVSIEQFIAELKAFDGRKEVVKQVRTDIRAMLPEIRKAVKANALATLPKRGGLNRWVAAIRITSSLSVSGRRVRLVVKGGRNSSGGRSDVDAIDRGRVRAPSWGRRGKGAWHNQTVEPGFFTKPVTDEGRLRAAADQAFDKALEQIRRG